jgi:phosphate transport system protein
MIATRLHFTQELASVDEALMRMATAVGSMIAAATSSFLQCDVSRVPKVLADDDFVDRLEEEIEATCLRLLATQQPMARDLRRVSSAIKVSSELERIGDHAVEIAKNSRKLIQRCFCPRPLIDIEPMHKAVQSMLTDSLAAFVNHDIALVRDVCRHDDVVDDMFRVSRDDLFQLAQEDGSLVAAASYTLLVLLSLERIADHTTNIAERVNYIETGDLSRIVHEHKRENGHASLVEATDGNESG